MNQKYTNMDMQAYAISIGHNPESPAFPIIVEKLIDMAEYIRKRTKDETDSMYIQPE